ncbi:hypothetical protein OAE59_01705, partial [Synechococcus sp. AH-551-B05]
DTTAPYSLTGQFVFDSELQDSIVNINAGESTKQKILIDLSDFDDAGLAGSGVQFVSANWKNANDGSIYAYFYDNDRDGTFEASLDTEWKESGDWKLTSFDLSDRAGNNVSYYHGSQSWADSGNTKSSTSNLDEYKAATNIDLNGLDFSIVRGDKDTTISLVSNAKIPLRGVDLDNPEWIRLFAGYDRVVDSFADNYNFNVFLDDTIVDNEMSATAWKDTIDSIDQQISLDFTFVNDTSLADIIIKDISSFSKPGQYGEASTTYSNNAALNKIEIAVLSPNLSPDYKHSTIHEFGHGLGLEHPFEANDGDIWPGMTTAMDVFTEGPSTQTTSMSYNDGFKAADQVGSDEWLGADVVALQLIWGTENNPVLTEAGNLGKIKEDSAFTSGAFGAVEVVEGDHLEAMREITTSKQIVDPVTGFSSDGATFITSNSTVVGESSVLAESTEMSVVEPLSDPQHDTAFSAEVITADPLIVTTLDSTLSIDASRISTSIDSAGSPDQVGSDFLV